MIEFIPFIFLALAIVSHWHKSKQYTHLLGIASITTAYYFEHINHYAVISIFSFIALCYGHKRSTHLILKNTFFFLIIVATFTFYLHLIPGFTNPLILNKHQFSSSSVPFNLYINFDKTFIGFALLYFFNPKASLNDLIQPRLILMTTLITIIVLLGPGIFLGHIRWDPKLSIEMIVWSFNNLLFVCVAEEMLFRGVIQRSLDGRLSERCQGRKIALIVAAVLFGLAHFKGGLVYVILSTMAGLFYGYIFYKTRKVENSILVHFLLNQCHLVLFTYPKFLH